MVQIGPYLADPDGVVSEAREERPLAVAQADEDPVTATQRRLAGAGQVGQGLHRRCRREGVEQFGEMVNKVDFPKFVGGLIQGVFEAIVDSSIRQMHAYGELLANVSKSVGEFAQDNITENNARDWLVDQFPDALEVSTSSMSGGFDVEGGEPVDQPVVTLRDGADEDALSAKLATMFPARRGRDRLSDPEQECACSMRPVWPWRVRAAAPCVDGPARYQPNRCDRRADPRQGRVRHEGI